MSNLKLDKEGIVQEDVLRDEMMYLRLRLESVSHTPIILKLLMDLALKLESHKADCDLEIKDYLDATSMVNTWVDNLEKLLDETVH